ncbi:hypothetical protein RchiOBHm_Chr1g0363721 [Rosa chinensis]|uniref:Transmembrane protein n=1 Tax=Rosa chinensis TaxID=74649 RepID=A0A2P6SJJ9_ROSCH|nr:hypothetical protein RchiOBHm_Chr1g0363721 [Rosa chinensis]
MVRRWSGLSGLWYGPERVAGSPGLGGTDRTRSVSLISGAEAGVQQRRTSAFQWWFLASSILRGWWLWRFRLDRGWGDLEWDLPMLWSGIALWPVAWCRGWLRCEKAVTQRRVLAQQRIAAGRRHDGDGAHWRREWLQAAIGLGCGRWCLGWVVVFRSLWWSLISGCLGFLCLVLVVVLVKISPSSCKRGFGGGCFCVVSMPLFWCHGWSAVSWSGLLSVLSGYQCDGESPLHVFWLFWDAVSERVKTVHCNVGGWVVLVQVWLVLVVARRYGRRIWLGVGPLWLMEVTYGDGPVTMDPIAL